MLSDKPIPPPESPVRQFVPAGPSLQLTGAEEKLIERLRATRAATLIMVFVGGDGQPKQLFAQEGQIEVLAR